MPYKIENLKRLKPNSYYEGLLHNLYGGEEGEVVSFLQYNFQKQMLSPFESKIKEMFAEFAIDELQHANIIAYMIVLLGGTPKLCNSAGKWVTGRNLDYIKDIKKMLSLNLENKNKNIIDYKTTLSKIDNIEIKKYLNVILANELSHRELLKKEIDLIKI